MTGFGSPCGACKFLRRKCAKGCVFAPYFCHDQGAEQFAAIHKVFGASNVSKLLMHLPVSDRHEAAVTISYEAQARIQDPIYGCISHIFALQQQVVNLQAQLTTFKAQAEAVQGMSSMSSYSSTSSSPQEEGIYHNNFPSYQQNENAQGYFQMQTSVPDHYARNDETMVYNENSYSYLDYNEYSNMSEDGSSCEIGGAVYSDMDDLQSAAFAFLHHT